MAAPATPHPSLWMDTSPATDFPPLAGEIDVDVAIVGAGITGLAVAYRLKRAGVRVAVIEANRVAMATTGHTTAKVTSLHALTYAGLVSEAGEEQARQYADANQAAIEEIARIVEAERIACDFRRAPAYTYTTDQGRLGAIEAEVEAARTVGLPASFATPTELPFPVAGAIRLENQAMFHPRLFCLALAAAIPGDGSHLFEQTRATDVSCDERCEVVTRRGVLRAGHVVLATQIPFLDRGGFFARTSPSRSYAMAARLTGEPPEGMYLSADEPAYSIRPYHGMGGPLVILGGEGHKVGQEEDTRRRYEALEAWGRKQFDIVEIPYRWSAQDYMPVDGVPYIGKLTPMSDRILVATGFRKWGMTTGMVAGMLLSDAILGRDNPWRQVFDATRLDITRSAKRFITENMNVATRFVWDRLSRLNAGSVDDLAPDSGGIVELDDAATAVYRDADGAIHAVSPTCAHLGCTLSWNSAERTWDCPCHGSRYDVDGHVFEGPSVRDLERKHTAGTTPP